MVVNADAPLAFLLYKAEELPSYLRPHVAHRLVVCESQRLRSHEHRDANKLEFTVLRVLLQSANNLYQSL